MDSTKKDVQIWILFPPEIWTSITSYLPGEQIGRLKITGSKPIWSLLVAPRAVESIKLGRDFLIFKRWPAFLDELSDVKEFTVDTANNEWWSLWQPTLDKMPKTLKKLEIYASTNCIDSFFAGKGSSKLSLGEHLPHLEYLGLSMDWSMKHSWTSQIPENLTFLRCASWDFSVPLPDSLIHLKASNIVLRDDYKVTFPPGMASIETVCISASLVRHLPSSLVSFIQNSIPPYDFTPELFQQLPKSLTRLKAFLGISILTNPVQLLEFPRHLTDLSIASLPSESWPSLPSTIKRLKLENLIASNLTLTRTIAHPQSGQSHQFRTLPIHTLPKSITHLTLLPTRDFGFGVSVIYLDGDEQAENDRDHHLNSDLQMANMDPKPETSSAKSAQGGQVKIASSNLHSFFPPGLTHLDTVRIQFSVNAAKQLPSSLTSLKIHNLDEHVCEHLPRGLTKLKSASTILSLNLIKRLPSLSLKTLVLRFTFPVIPLVIDPQTGAPTKLDKVKFYANRINGNEISSASKLLWQGDYNLPPHLTKLDLARFEALKDKVLNAQLKNTTKLNFGSTTKFTDSSILMLPPLLTHLDLSSAKKVTGKCFIQLPRCLTHLRLDSSPDIYDSHIPSLPPGLQFLVLDATKRLTNECALRLPRSLTFVTFLACTKITPDALPLLPYQLRHPSPPMITFSTKNRYIYKGNFVAKENPASYLI